MTVSANQPNRWEYTGDASTDTFAYKSRIFAASDLVVYVDGASQSTGFSVTGVGNASGGNVVFDTAPASAALITIVRDVPEAQPSSLPLGGAFPSTLVEQELDRLAIIAQQLEARFDRALRYADSDQGVPSAILPSISTLEGKFLTFDANGAPVVATEVDLGAALTPSDPITWTGVQTFQGDQIVDLVALNPLANEYSPILNLFADRPVVATNDLLCRINFEGRNTSGVRQPYASINSSMHNASEDDGQMDVSVRIAGSMVNGYRFDSAGSIPRVGAFWTDATSSEGPYCASYRKITPAANDPIGAFVCVALNDASESLNFVKLRGTVIDPADGSEDSKADLQVYVAGSLTSVLSAGPGVAVGSPTGGIPSTAGLMNATGYQKDGGTLVVGHLLDETTISTNQVDYTVTWDNTKGYKSIEVLVSRFRPAVDDTPTLRTSTDGGSTYDSGASDYQWTLSAGRTGGTAGAGDVADSEIELHDNALEADDGNSASYRFLVIDPGNANSDTAILFSGSVLQSNGAYSNVWGQGQRLAEADVDGLRLAFLTQQIAEAQVRVIGYF